VDALVDAMNSVLSDAALRRSLTEAGFVRAATFTWEAAAHKTAEVYRSVLK
jgi:glycosyltransferase involved in cell wall biosynthesis